MSLHGTTVLEPSGTEQSPTSPASVASAEVSCERGSGLLAWAGGVLPTLLVLTVLAGLACWGHASGWRMPRFAQLMGQASVEAEDWCPAHSVPESLCVECNPDTFPPPAHYAWCKEHGIPDCPLEHPDVAQMVGSPQVGPADRECARRALRLLPRTENNSKCKLHQRRLQFASAEVFARSGIEVEPVWREPMSEFVRANGEVAYDPTRVARLSSRAAGTVWRVEKKVGDPVKAGETIVLIDAREVGRSKAELLHAIAQHRLKSRTLQSLREAGQSVAAQRLREGEAELRDAEIRLLDARQTLVNLGLPVDVEDFQDLPETRIAARLQFLGLPDAVRRTLDSKTTTANLLPLRAPLEGVVTECQVVAGEVVDVRKVLLVVADVRRMWLTLHVGQEDAQQARPRSAGSLPPRWTRGSEGEPRLDEHVRG